MENYFNKIHHVGYLVKNIEKAYIEFEKIGYTKITEIVYDARRDIEICFLVFDKMCVELVCPKSKDSVVYSLLKKKGVGPYHICYEVSNLKVVGALLREQGYLLINEALEAPAIHNRKVEFWYHKYLGMVELLE